MNKRTVRTCGECRKTKKLNSFDGNNRVCKECTEKIKNKSYLPKFKLECKEIDGKILSTCKKCGEFKEVQSKKVTFFICKECKDRIEKELEENSKRDLCDYCGNEFISYKRNNSHICKECKIYKSKCIKCNKIYSREENFKIRKFICDECSKKIQDKEEFKSKYRLCNKCKEQKEIGKDITRKAFFCFKCLREKIILARNKLKKPSWTRICPDCGTEVITKTPHATIVYCEKCRNKKKKLSKEYKLKKINRIPQDYCQICNEYTPNKLKKDRVIVCNKCRDYMEEFKKSCRRGEKYFKICRKCGEEFEASKSRFWNPINCRKCAIKDPITHDKSYRFGYRGKCSDGHSYASLNEQDYDEWLKERGIKHIPQFRMKPTYRRCDFYLPDYNIYLEIDGMEREDDIDWYGKLSDYENLNLKLNKDYFILKPVFKNFVTDKEVCFSEIDKLLLPILKRN